MYCGPFLSVAYFDPRYYDLKVAYLTKIVGVHQSGRQLIPTPALFLCYRLLLQEFKRLSKGK